MNPKIPQYSLLDNEHIRVSRLEERHTAKYFPTHRHKYYEMVIIISCEGLFSHNIDFVSYPLDSGFIYFIAPNQAHGWNTKVYNKEYKGYILTFNEEFLLTDNIHLELQLKKLFNPLNTEPYIEFNPSKFIETFPTMYLLEEEYRKKDSNYFILRSLLETLIHYMAELKSVSLTYGDVNSQRFIVLIGIIEDYYKKERHVEFYARKLELSAKRLNEITRETAGLTVTQMIHKRLLLEAKRELITQDMTIQMISDNLGFENASYFARFFKNHEGISPTQFTQHMFK
jgi:AraC-like DNA-binding protein